MTEGSRTVGERPVTHTHDDDCLQCAWNQVGSAPKDWRPRFTFQRGDDFAPLSGTWYATAGDVDDEAAGYIGSGPTPAGALRALAAKLRESDRG